MDLLFFIAHNRIKLLLQFKLSQWPKTLFQIFFIVISVANGIVFGSLIDSNRISLDTLFLNSKNITFLLVIVSILLFDFVPSYVKRANVILRYYPVSALQRQVINIVVEVLAIPKIAIGVFLISLFFFSDFFMLSDLAFSFLLILLAVLISRVIRGVIELGFIKIHSLFLLAILGALILLIFVQNFIIQIPLLFILIYISNLLDQNLEKEKKLYKSGQMSFYSTLLFPFYISNIKIALLLAFCSKAALLLYVLKSTSEVSNAIQVLVISPVTVFTYVYNNAWGFFRSIWYQTQIRSNSIQTQAKLYFNFLIGPILLEAFLTFALLAAFDQVNAFHVYVYFISLINLAIIGFIISINFPVNVRDGINPFLMKASTSAFGMIADFILIIIVWSPKWHPLATLIVIATTSLLFIYGYYLIRRKHSSKMHEVFEVI